MSRMMLCLLALSAFFAICGAQAPEAITWPTQWHASVVVAQNTVTESLTDFVDVVSSGQYFYDAHNQQAAFILTVPPSSRSIREVVTNSSVEVIDGPTGICATVSPSSNYRYTILPTNFLIEGKFEFVAIEYYLRDGVFFETYHWSGKYNSDEQMDYWHAVETNSPFRLRWGTITYTQLEFSNVMAGFYDVPNIDYVFFAPAAASCNNETEVADVPQTNPERKVEALSGDAWPLQWTAKSAYTGNDFGFTATEDAKEAMLGVLGEPTTVAISLAGQYYYDWANLRECNTWINVQTGALSKTFILNGTYYYITAATNKCVIVPIAPVNGPLKYTWPTGLSYLDEQLIMGPQAYTRAKHYYFDAFNVGPEHSFHYWQTSAGTPMQFQGPVLDFYPYGQSMMVWTEMATGLAGADLVDLFTVPENCSKIGEDDPRIPLFHSLHPMLQLNKIL